MSILQLLFMLNNLCFLVALSFVGSLCVLECVSALFGALLSSFVELCLPDFDHDLNLDHA